MSREPAEPGGPARRTAGGRRQRRPLELVRGSWGAVCLLAPASVLRACGSDPDRRAVLVTRILGARQLTQAVLSGRRPSPPVLAVGVWVDTVHSLTAVALGALDRGRARPALLDAAIAGAWAAGGRRALHHDRPVERGSWETRTAVAVLPHLPGAPDPSHSAQPAPR